MARQNEYMMIGELEELQESDEDVWQVGLSFDVETRCEESGEVVHKQYTFNYVKEWDKWVFQEYEEKRTPANERVAERDWRKARHVFWNDIGEQRSIDVPPEVSEELARATGSESVTIQVPNGSVDETKYDQFTYECSE
jgi:hypothetical protein